MAINAFIDNAKVMAKDQVTIPKDVREALGITSGDRITFDKFLSVALLTLELIPVPENEFTTETQIRDTKDRPILRAAVAAKADILLTGDKDFLESGVKKPSIMTPAEFLQLK